MWSKKWYLKRNRSCDSHLLNELLETDMPWDDAIVVLAGKLRKLWDSLSELRSSLCERRLEKDSSEACYCLSKLRSLLSFPSGMIPHSKIAQFNWECTGHLILIAFPLQQWLHESAYVPLYFCLIIVQRNATQISLFIILQVHSTRFGCQPHPSSWVHKTVTTASGTGHNFCAATSLQRDLTWPRWREVAA